MPKNVIATFQESVVISLLKNGNETGLKIIIDRYQFNLTRYVKRMLADFMVAEEIVADSFMGLWERRTDFEQMVSIQSFLYKSVRNAAINHLRRVTMLTRNHERIKYLLEDTEDALKEIGVSDERLPKLRHHIAMLPRMQRLVCELLFFKGLTSTEVADVLHITVATVRVQKARALQTMRQYIQRQS